MLWITLAKVCQVIGHFASPGGKTAVNVFLGPPIQTNEGVPVERRKGNEDRLNMKRDKCGSAVRFNIRLR